jgi:serine/threonine-protein kinase
VASPIREGDLIRGKYRVERVLGEGGMGVVVAAWHLHLQRRMAIKFLLPALREHPSIVERFLREGRAASAIEGEHIAKVIDVDTLEDGTPFLVMEYLEGEDLRRVLDRGARVNVGQAVGWVLEACDGVARAHALGIVHRDLKPANLFLAVGRDGRQRVKVLDFGISKVIEAGAKNLTRTHVTMGSTEYMSPEQCLSARDVDARADVWALGVVLYELLTRRVPYSGESPTQVYARAMAGPPTPPRLLRPNVPAALEAVILQCLERDLSARIRSVAELAAMLAPFALPIADTAMDLAMDDTVDLPPERGAAATLRARARTNEITGGVVARDAPRPPRRWSALGLAAAVLGGGVGAGVLILSRSRPDRPLVPNTAAAATPAVSMAESPKPAPSAAPPASTASTASTASEAATASGHAAASSPPRLPRAPSGKPTPAKSSPAEPATSNVDPSREM